MNSSMKNESRLYHIVIGVFDSCEGEDSKKRKGCRDWSQTGDLRYQLETGIG